MLKLSIVVPAYNEERRIGKMLDAYSSYFEDLRNRKVLDYELLIVINNTTDRTEEIVNEFIKLNKNIRCINLIPGGKGYATIEGFRECLKGNSELIGFVDADLATRPEDFYDLVRKIGKSQGAIASRYIPGAVIEPRPTIQRLVAKRMFNMLVRAVLFLPYRDTQCGAKVFRREALKTTIPTLTMSQWAFDVELLYNLRKRGFAIREIPTRWTDKEYAKIHFWEAGPKMALGVLRLRILNSPFRKLMRIYDLL